MTQSRPSMVLLALPLFLAAGVLSLAGCEHSGTAAHEPTAQPAPATTSAPAPKTETDAQAPDKTIPPTDAAVTESDNAEAVAQPDEPKKNLDEIIADAVATKAAVDANGNPVVLQVKALPGGVRVLVPEKTFEVEGPDGALRVSYDDLDLLKVINMEPVTKDAPKYFPDWLKNLEGQRVRIRGFMYPEFQPTGLEMFSLARDTQICCFGRDPKVYDVFRVILRDGVTTDYIELKPFDVVGVFHIDPVELGGDLVQMYYIDDAVIVRK